MTAASDMDIHDREDWRSMAEMLDRSGLHLWQSDKHHKILFSSPGFRALFGLSDTVLHGKPLNNPAWIDGCDDLAKFQEIIQQKKNFDNLSVEFQPDHEERKNCLFSGEAVFDGSGNFCGYRGTCKADLTGSANLSDLDRWKDLAFSGADWFWEFDADLRISYASESQEKVTGIPNAHFFGRERPEFEGADFDEESLRLHLEDLKARRAFKDYTYPISAPDGGTRWFRISGRPHFDADGVFAGYRGIGRDFTEQQDALVQTRRSEQFLLDAIELVPTGLSIWDKDERFVIANAGLKKNMPAFTHLLETPGITMEEYTREVALTGYIPEANGRVEEWVQERMARHREASGKPFENQRVDGTWIRVSSYRTNSGGVLTTSIDITELKEREEDLRKMQLQLTDALESIGQGFAIYDEKDCLILTNTAFREMFPGKEHVLVPGTHFEDVLRAGGIANQMKDVEGFVRKRMEMRRTGTTDRVIEISPGVWKIVSDIKSQAGGIVSVWTDISQLKEQEEALRETESRFTIAFHSSPLMMAIIRLESGKYVEVNNKFEELTGYDRKELLGTEGIQISIMADENIRNGLNSRLMRGQEIDDMEVVMRHKSGKLFDILLSGDIIEVDGEQRLLLVGMDFSSHKRLEKSLLEAKNEAEFANHTKSEFLANMSHELRTPLNAVIGFSEFLANEVYGSLGDPRYKEYVGDIRDSGTHLLNLINEILDVAKVEAGKMELREKEIDLEDMMARCVRSVIGRAQHAGLTISGTVDNGLPFLYCDETKFRQIMINVLNNAVKFTDEGGAIIVGGDLTEKGDLEIRITDNGIGIAPADMETVFKVFGQAEASLDRRFEGAGLGLPLTKALVELHGGDFRLESEVGEGTTVFITFPKERLVSPDWSRGN